MDRPYDFMKWIKESQPPLDNTDENFKKWLMSDGEPLNTSQLVQDYEHVIRASDKEKKKKQNKSNKNGGKRKKKADNEEKANNEEKSGPSVNDVEELNHEAKEDPDGQSLLQNGPEVNQYYKTFKQHLLKIPGISTLKHKKWAKRLRLIYDLWREKCHQNETSRAEHLWSGFDALILYTNYNWEECFNECVAIYKDPEPEIVVIYNHETSQNGTDVFLIHLATRTVKTYAWSAIVDYIRPLHESTLKKCFEEKVNVCLVFSCAIFSKSQLFHKL